MMHEQIVRAYQLRDQGRPDEAAKLCADLLNDNPRDVEALFCYGSTMIHCERFGLSSNIFARCMELVPQSWEAMVNYALSLISLNEFTEAEQVLHKVLKLNPQSTAALNNLALLHISLVNPSKAIDYAQQSLALNPEQPEALESLGYAQLMLGDFENGWVGYEAMLNASKYRKVKPLRDEPYWTGQKGGRLYIKGEQGIGDEISFASILPDAMKDNEIILDCEPKLEGLFKRSFPGIEVHGTRYTPDKKWRDWRSIDYGCLIGTLAHHYRKNEKAFPGTPYLVADQERRTQWKALLDTLPGHKVGIAWTGGLRNTFAARRSLSLETLAPILKTEGITWVSLQYKDPSAEISRFIRKHGVKIHHWSRGAESKDYDDQAALVSELDAVVSVTTGIVHLCGALGRKCFVLVPSKPRWFYQTSGSRLSWYASVQLHRQSENWPLDSVRQALTGYLDGYQTFKAIMKDVA